MSTEKARSSSFSERYAAFARKIMPWFFLGIFGIFVYGIATTPSRPLTCEDYITNARVMSEQLVERHLNFPGSSHIPGVFEADFKTYCKDKTFRFDGWVDAANAFGAKQRMYYVQEMEFLGGDWTDIANWKETVFSFLEG